MLTFAHPLRPALLALAALAGLLLAPAGASASCEAMASCGAMASGGACCCSKPDATDLTRAEVAVDPPVVASDRACSESEGCCCEERPEAPAEPAPKPARVAEDRPAGRSAGLAVELPDLRPSSRPAGSTPLPMAGPPHVSLYLRNARFLI